MHDFMLGELIFNNFGINVCNFQGNSNNAFKMGSTRDTLSANRDLDRFINGKSIDYLEVLFEKLNNIYHNPNKRSTNLIDTTKNNDA